MNEKASARNGRRAVGSAERTRTGYHLVDTVIIVIVIVIASRNLIAMRRSRRPLSRRRLTSARHGRIHAVHPYAAAGEPGGSADLAYRE